MWDVPTGRPVESAVCNRERCLVEEAEGMGPVLVPGRCSCICCHAHVVPKLTRVVLTLCVGSQGTSAP